MVTAVELLSTGTVQTRDCGNTSGSSILFLFKTTRCMAILNSGNDNAPSFEMSDNCL